jgi:hypothetical protein
MDDPVGWCVFDETVQDVRNRNANIPVKELEEAAEDALEEVRAERFSAHD